MPAPPSGKKPLPKEEKEWASLLFGWIFIVVVLFGLVVVVLSSKPEGKMVCQTEGRAVSLTTFGYCHRE